MTDDVRVFLSDLESSGARLAYLTPSSQFPTCRIMPTDVRERVLAWAEAADAYILEDDYCRDFRYRERSLAPLVSMDARGRVIYMGTFSKSLSPALRMNYLVLPTPLLKRWREAFASSYSPGAWLNQQVLARFMTDGSWDRHLRRVQTRNRRKYDALTAALREYMGDKVDVLECGTGLHLLVRVRDGRSQDEARGRRRCGGVPHQEVLGQSRLCHRGRRARGVLLHCGSGHPPRHRRPGTSMVRVGDDSCCGLSRHP